MLTLHASALLEFQTVVCIVSSLSSSFLPSMAKIYADHNQYPISHRIPRRTSARFSKYVKVQRASRRRSLTPSLVQHDRMMNVNNAGSGRCINSCSTWPMRNKGGIIKEIDVVAPMEDVHPLSSQQCLWRGASKVLDRWQSRRISQSNPLSSDPFELDTMLGPTSKHYD